MSLDQAQFLRFFYEIVIFEYTLDYGSGFEVSLLEISNAFKIAANVFRDHPDMMSSPCLKFIRAQGLDDATLVIDFLCDCPPRLLPKRLVIEPSLLGLTTPMLSSDESRTYFDYLGYKFTKSLEVKDVVVVVLPQWNHANEDQFRINYMDHVPDHYKDDLAVLAFRCRTGLAIPVPGFVSRVHNNQRSAIGKYSRAFAESTLSETKLLLQQSHSQVRVCTQRKDQEYQQLLDRIRRGGDMNDKDIEAVRKWDSKIDDYMVKIMDSTMASTARQQQIRNLAANLERTLRQSFNRPLLEVCLCGSYGSGLCTKDSDADFTVINYSGAIDSVVSLSNVLRKAGYENVRAIPYAHIPIVMFIDPETKVECDMSLDQPLGGLAAKMISTYRQIDDRFMPLWFAVRELTKAHDIWSGRKQNLPSYALVLMIINNLQSKKVPVLPCLHKQPRMTRFQFWQWDCSFDEKWSRHRPQIQANENRNPQTPAEMLRWFCYFYGYQWKYGTYEVNVRRGRYRASRRTVHATDLYQREKLKLDPMCVMDPFARDQNVTANVSSATVDRIRTAFRTAYDSLAQGDLETAFNRQD